MTTISELIKAFSVTMTYEEVDPTPAQEKQWGRGATHYKVTLTAITGDKRRQYTTEYHQGSAHTQPPKLDDVLNCLVGDALCADGRTFEEFAHELGYDEDSRSAERIYRACQRTNNALKRMLPNVDLYDVETL